MSLYHESESEEELADQSGEFGENAKSNIFGRATQECRPLIPTSSEIAFDDPMRTVKVEIKSLLIANRVLTAEQLAKHYRDLYGYTIPCSKYGCSSIEDLLSKMNDITTCYIDGSGRKTYIAKTDEKHEDLEYMIQRQRSPSPLGKRTNRQPCYNGLPRGSSTKQSDIPPASDQKYRVPWLKDRIAPTRVIGEFPCAPVTNRLVFYDDGPKCKDRCRAIAKMVRDIGEESPDGTEVRCHIEKLKNYYYEQTGLSIWGKMMSIAEYAEAWSAHQYYEFWRIMTEKSGTDTRYFIVVPTDPANNYFVPPRSNSADYMIDDEQGNSDVLDNNFVQGDFGLSETKKAACNTDTSEILESDSNLKYCDNAPIESESELESSEKRSGIATLDLDSSINESQWDIQVEKLNEQLNECHLTRPYEENNSPNEYHKLASPEKPSKKISPGGFRIVQCLISSHARDCERRNPRKPCNLLPTDRDDLKARQLPPVSSAIAMDALCVSDVTTISSINHSMNLRNIPVIPSEDRETFTKRAIRFSDKLELADESSDCGSNEYVLAPELKSDESEDSDGSMIIYEDNTNCKPSVEPFLVDNQCSPKPDSLNQITTEEELSRIGSKFIMTNVATSEARLCALHNLIGLSYMIENSLENMQLTDLILQLQTLINMETKK